MTSGNFTSFPIEQIYVDRENRQRKQLKNIEELAVSIKTHGLIHPIVIQKDGQLRVGERRYTAIKLLGWTMVPVQFIEDLPEDALKAIELEENLRRENITWEEECLAVEEYHKLQVARDENWTAVKTAEMLGMSPPNVTAKREVARELMAGNERVVNADKFSTARGIVQRSAERAKASVLDSVQAPSIPEPEAKVAPIELADFAVWQADYAGPKFNFIHCDFPYGVKADKHNQGAAKSFGGYEDSPDVYWKLCDVLFDAMENVVADSAHLIFWFSMDYYSETSARLQEMGWRVNPFPLVWHKSDNSGILPDPTRGPRRVYETAFFASRGDRKIVSAVSNVKAYPNTKEIHMSEKPRGMLEHFFRMTVDEYSYMLDPTCGSANAVRVADGLGASTVLGLEKSEEFYTLAKENYYGED